MGEFDTDNDMMAEQQASDTHGHSRDAHNTAKDADAQSGADRRAAHTAIAHAAHADDAVLADNRAHLDKADDTGAARSGRVPPLAGRGRSLLGD